MVVRGAATSPVPTKAILRLARPEPVLTPVQIELAQWIAEAYVAPLSEAVRLFLPPGLLEKEGQAAGVRARRELRIQLLTDRATAEARLLAAAKPTARATVVAWLLQQPAASSTIAAVVANCQSASRSLVLTHGAHGGADTPGGSGDDRRRRHGRTARPGSCAHPGTPPAYRRCPGCRRRSVMAARALCPGARGFGQAPAVGSGRHRGAAGGSALSRSPRGPHLSADDGAALHVGTTGSLAPARSDYRPAAGLRVVQF